MPGEENTYHTPNDNSINWTVNPRELEAGQLDGKPYTMGPFEDPTDRMRPDDGDTANASLKTRFSNLRLEVDRDSIVTLVGDTVLGAVNVDSIAGKGLNEYLETLQRPLRALFNGRSVTLRAFTEVEFTRDEDDGDDEMFLRVSSLTKVDAEAKPLAKWTVRTNLILDTNTYVSTAGLHHPPREGDDETQRFLTSYVNRNHARLPAGGDLSTLVEIIIQVTLPDLTDKFDSVASQLESFLSGLSELYDAAANSFKEAPTPTDDGGGGDTPDGGDGGDQGEEPASDTLESFLDAMKQFAEFQSSAIKALINDSFASVGVQLIKVKWESMSKEEYLASLWREQLDDELPQFLVEEELESRPEGEGDEEAPEEGDGGREEDSRLRRRARRVSRLPLRLPSDPLALLPEKPIEFRVPTFVVGHSTISSMAAPITVRKDEGKEAGGASELESSSAMLG